MGEQLSSLSSRLQGLVAARNGTPTSAQYDQAVKDAVADLSERAPRTKIATISLVSGTASYALPTDFLKEIRVESLTTPDSVIISSQGLIPVSATWSERWTISGTTITFYPTPTYALARDIEYMAGHVLDGTSTYPDLTAREASIALLLAQSLALRIKANRAADEAWSYTKGEERVSKEKLATAMSERADELRRGYLAAVQAHVGAVGMR